MLPVTSLWLGGRQGMLPVTSLWFGGRQGMLPVTSLWLGGRQGMLPVTSLWFGGRQGILPLTSLWFGGKLGMLPVTSFAPTFQVLIFSYTLIKQFISQAACGLHHECTNLYYFISTFMMKADCCPSMEIVLQLTILHYV